MLGVLCLSCLDVPFYNKLLYKRSEAVLCSSVVLVLIKLETDVTLCCVNTMGTEVVQLLLLNVTLTIPHEITLMHM